MRWASTSNEYDIAFGLTPKPTKCSNTLEASNVCQRTRKLTQQGVCNIVYCVCVSHAYASLWLCIKALLQHMDINMDPKEIQVFTCPLIRNIQFVNPMKPPLTSYKSSSSNSKLGTSRWRGGLQHACLCVSGRKRERERERERESYLLEPPKCKHQSVIWMNIRGQSKRGTDGLKSLIGPIKVPYICTTQNYAI